MESSHLTSLIRDGMGGCPVHQRFTEQNQALRELCIRRKYPSLPDTAPESCSLLNPLSHAVPLTIPFMNFDDSRRRKIGYNGCNDHDRRHRCWNNYGRSQRDGINVIRMETLRFASCPDYWRNAERWLKQVNHFEGTGIKRQKYGEPDTTKLAKEVSQVVRCALEVATYYGIENRVEAEFSSSYQWLKTRGYIPGEESSSD